MSAHLCEDHHFLYLVAAAMSRAIGTQYGSSFSWYWKKHPEDSTLERGELAAGDLARAAKVASLLYRENARSLAYRYPGDSSLWPLLAPDAQLFQPHQIVLLSGFDPVQVLKSCHCYRYQSCEHPEWESSEAAAFITALEAAAITALPGYDAAKWGAPEPTSSLRAIAERVPQNTLTLPHHAH